MRFSTSRPVARFAASVAIAGTIGLSGGTAALAQDATPAGTPIGPGTSECLAPALAGDAAPVASPAGSPAATPVGETDALPAGPVVEDEAVINEATAAIENLYTCFNEGNGESVVALFTDAGREAAFGPRDPAAIAEHLTAKSTQVQAGNIVVNSVTDLGDEGLAVDYQVTIGKQVFNYTDVIVESDGTWKVNDRLVNLPETDLDSTTAGIETSVEGGSMVFEISPNPLMNQPAVKLQLANVGQNTHHITILQNTGGVDPATVTDLDLANLPDGVTFIGEGSAVSGARTDTLFENLEEGSYIVVGQVIDDTGEPTGEGSSTELTIDPPFDPDA